MSDEVKTEIPVQKIKRVKKRNKKQAEITKWDYNPPVFFYERLVPKTDAELSDIAQEMIKWALRDESLVFSKFFSERRPPMNMRDIYTLAERSQDLREAIEITKQILGGRREEGGINWKYNFQAIKETQPLYDPEYRKWKLEAIKSTAPTGNQFVVLPSIPTPDKIEKEESSNSKENE